MQQRPVAFVHKKREFKKFDEFGVYATVSRRHGPHILYIPMLADGTPERLEAKYSDTRGPLNISQVTHPDSQEFLNAINWEFGTVFTMEQFERNL